MTIEPGTVLCDMHDGFSGLKGAAVLQHIRIPLHHEDVGAAAFIERVVSAARGEPWSPYCNKLLTVVGESWSSEDGYYEHRVQAMYSYDFSTLGVVELRVLEEDS